MNYRYVYFFVGCILPLFGIFCPMLDKLGCASAIDASIMASGLHKFSWTIARYAPAKLSQNLLENHSKSNASYFIEPTINIFIPFSMT